MRTTLTLSTLLISLLILSCEKDKNSGIEEGFTLTINDSLFIDHTQIDFYDFSTHLIYLKSGNSFSFDGKGTFSVFADNEHIYSGQMFPIYLSSLPVGSIITSPSVFFGDYIIPIEFFPAGETIADPRDDIRIINCLKKFNQYREGLSCNISDVRQISQNRIQIDLKLSNTDADALYYLDPDKMGMNLFHYFTNGLILIDQAEAGIPKSHRIHAESPNPWNTWEMDWLSVILSDQQKTITITYNDYELLAPGEYNAIFTFPGLGSQIAREELFQNNIRIWLGKSQTTKTVTIE